MAALHPNDLTRRKRKSGCLVLVAAAPVLVFLLLWALGGFLVVGDRLQRSDTVVLLSGGDIARLGEAVRIYQAGLAHRLLITETGSIPKGGGPRASTLLQRQAVTEGVAAGDIQTTLGKSSSTRDEAAAVLEFCEREGLDSIIVVTDPYHTRRTQLIFKDVFSGSGIQVSIRPVRDHWYRSMTWFLHLRGWQMTISEYAKLTAMMFGIQGD